MHRVRSDTAGPVTVTVTADPAQSLFEQNRRNNVAVLGLNTLPVSRVDVCNGP